MADPTLAGVFYALSYERPAPLADSREYGSNIISATNSAWSIAGGDYDKNTTAYLLPDGRTLPGNRIKGTIGWNYLPLNTKVLLNQDDEPGVIQTQAQTPIKTISGSMTA